MDEEDELLREEEICALLAIYPDDIDVSDDQRVVILKPRSDCHIKTFLPKDYPSRHPPTFQLDSYWTLHPDGYGAHISQLLDEAFVSGTVVLFEWFTIVRDFLDESVPQSANLMPEEEPKEQDVVVAPQEPELEIDTYDDVMIHHSEPFTDRKSTFQAHVARVTTTKEIKRVLKKLKANGKIARATHNMVAYRIMTEHSNVLQDNDDDGEHGASSRMLHLLQILDVINVVVVVTRWYGGIHLGPDRFKHINSATRNCLAEFGFISSADDSKGKKKKK